MPNTLAEVPAVTAQVAATLAAAIIRNMRETEPEAAVAVFKEMCRLLKATEQS